MIRSWTIAAMVVWSGCSNWPFLWRNVHSGGPSDGGADFSPPPDFASEEEPPDLSATAEDLATVDSFSPGHLVVERISPGPFGDEVLSGTVHFTGSAYIVSGPGTFTAPIGFSLYDSSFVTWSSQQGSNAAVGTRQSSFDFLVDTSALPNGRYQYQLNVSTEYEGNGNAQPIEVYNPAPNPGTLTVNSPTFQSGATISGSFHVTGMITLGPGGWYIFTADAKLASQVDINQSTAWINLSPAVSTNTNFDVVIDTTQVPNGSHYCFYILAQMAGGSPDFFIDPLESVVCDLTVAN